MLVVLWVLKDWAQRRLMYYPSRQFDASPEVLGRPWSEFNLVTSDGVTIHGWFFPPAADVTGGRHVFLVCHGNGGNISHRLELARVLLETGAGVVLFDYRGYGKSSGKPTEAGTYLDAETVYRFVLERGFAPGSIIAYGESLGGGVATELALRQPVAALVLQSTFTSIPDMAGYLYPWLPIPHKILTPAYNTRAKLPRVHVPVLVLHSPIDSLVPYRMAVENYAVANEPKFFHQLTLDHNDPVSLDPNFRAGIGQLLEFLRTNTPVGEPQRG